MPLRRRFATHHRSPIPLALPWLAILLVKVRWLRHAAVLNRARFDEALWVVHDLCSDRLMCRRHSAVLAIGDCLLVVVLLVLLRVVASAASRSLGGSVHSSIFASDRRSGGRRWDDCARTVVARRTTRCQVLLGTRKGNGTLARSLLGIGGAARIVALLAIL